MAYKKIWDQHKPRDTQKSRINVNIKRKKDTNIKRKKDTNIKEKD